VHAPYFEPKYEEICAADHFGVSRNAFTSAFELEPIPQFRTTAKLGEFLDARFLPVVLIVYRYRTDPPPRILCLTKSSSALFSAGRVSSDHDHQSHDRPRHRWEYRGSLDIVHRVKLWRADFKQAIGLFHSSHHL